MEGYTASSLIAAAKSHRNSGINFYLRWKWKKWSEFNFQPYFVLLLMFSGTQAVSKIKELIELSILVQQGE